MSTYSRIRNAFRAMRSSQPKNADNDGAPASGKQGATKELAGGKRVKALDAALPVVPVPSAKRAKGVNAWSCALVSPAP